MRTEDGYIIRECLNGDKSAFALLIDKYKAGVYAIAYTKLLNFQDAEDITQEVFIKAFQKLSTLRNYDRVMVWLHSITRNLCKDFIRSHSKQPDKEFIEDQGPKFLDNHSLDSYKEGLTNETINDAINSLPETYRQVLTLHYLGGMRDSEIAEMLGMSYTNVRQRLMKARTQLKEEMISMMERTFEEQKLRAGFTFRLVEMIKRIKINPIAQTKNLPWGLSLATGLIGLALSINPHFIQSDLFNVSSFLSSSKAKVLEAGEIPINIINISQIPNISKGVNEGKGSEQPNMQNALTMAPKAEGGTWTRKTNMPTGRQYVTGCELNGKFYAVGGFDLGLEFFTMEEYDPSTDKWTRKANMPTGGGGISACGVNGKLYAMGGYKGAVLATVEEYDPVSDTWTKKTDMPTARWAFCTASINGKIYAIGGATASIQIGDALRPFNSTASIEEYDPATDTWAKKNDIPVATGGATAVSINDKIYVIGGADDVFKPFLSTVWEYDPIADKWTRKSNMPTSRALLSSSAVNNRIYAIGGAINAIPTMTSSVEEYDPITDTWTRRADMLVGRSTMATDTINDKIYAIGGSAFAFDLSSVVEEYDPGSIPIDPTSINPSGKLQGLWGKIKAK